ncbi:MAG: flagellar basal-body MS-ring/collar protein FliF [Pseudomonadota bacterium]
MLNQLSDSLTNFGALGAKKLAILASVGIVVIAAVMLGAVYVNKPAFQTIYVGLEHDDVTRMGIALSEAGLSYDVNAEGNSIGVAAGQTSRARMILAEKGLPSSSSNGYELFDDLGSLGLTAFMQEVTRVRALEGEISRSIQTIQGVKAARVHIVMAEQGNFRRAEQAPTASVIVRYNGMSAESTALSIRHLVSAAVPMLTSENVTVLDASGRLLAAGSDPLGKSAGSSLGIKTNVENQIVSSIERSLTPYLGGANFRVSVQADISTDQRSIEETIFDPESRVERSVQVVRSENSSAQANGSEAVTVEQDVVDNVGAGDGGTSESERSERREETTNYELNSKRVATTSSGYSVNRLSVAVVVNRGSLITGNANPTPDEVSQRLDDIRGLIAAASGISEGRNDVIELTAVDFMPVEELVEPAAESIMSMILARLDSAINAIAFLVGIILLVVMGIRPLTKSLSVSGNSQPALESASSAPPIAAPAAAAVAAPETSAIASEIGNAPLSLPNSSGATGDTNNSGGDPSEIIAKMRPEPADRLEMIVDLDEARAAAILRRWVTQETA